MAPHVYKAMIGLAAFSALLPNALAAPWMTSEDSVSRSGSSILDARGLFGLLERTDYEESCEDYDAWADDEDDDEDAKRDLTDLNSLEARGNSKKKGEKNINACGGNIKATLRGYPGPTKLVTEDQYKDLRKKLKSYNYKNPKDCGDFTFESVTTPTNKAGAEGYNSEHILEVQLVAEFINALNVSEGAKFSNPVSSSIDLCTYMEPYWHDLPDKDKIEEINGKKLSEKKAEQPIKWIAAQYPQNGEGYLEEFVLLQGRVNGVKGNIWGGNAVTKAKIMDDDIAFTKKKNKKTEDKSDKEILEDYKKATQRWRNVYAVHKYHQDATIKSTLRTQATRVGKMFGYLEDKLPSISFKKEYNKKDKKMPTYVSKDLKSEWEKFMKQRNADIITKVNDWLKKWKTELENKKSDLEAKKKKASTAHAKKYTDIITQITNIADAYKNLGTWDNAFDTTIY